MLTGDGKGKKRTRNMTVTPVKYSEQGKWQYDE